MRVVGAGVGVGVGISVCAGVGVGVSVCVGVVGVGAVTRLSQHAQVFDTWFSCVCHRLKKKKGFFTSLSSLQKNSAKVRDRLPRQGVVVLL